jgi:hypothetical protein
MSLFPRWRVGLVRNIALLVQAGLRVTRWRVGLVCVLFAAELCPAQLPISAPPQAPNVATATASESLKATVIKMTLHPSAAPVPALKYHLLPEVRELKPGNAALLYQRAQSLDWWLPFMRTGGGERIVSLLDMPLRKMPRDKIVLIPEALRELELAARREYCDWEMTPRLRDEGFAALIPEVQTFRTFAHMLALRTRLALLDNHFDDAARDLQTGLALSRHVGQAPIIVHALVGMAVGHNMFDRVEEWVQLEQAPNLYWALADLPRPLLDLRRPLQGEKVAITSALPGIRSALQNRNQSPISVPTIQKYLDNLRYVGDKVAGDRLAFTLMAARTYPAAKKYLLEKGFSADQLAALPVIQVALMHALAEIDEYYDDAYKWHSFPYWQARPGLEQARQKLARLREDNPESMYLASILLPALDNVIFARARLDRRPAMLLVVEALRLHAAIENRLPDRLEEVRVPLPIDPVTGRTFEYTLQAANRAILYAPPPPGEGANDRNAIRYELTLALTKR